MTESKFLNYVLTESILLLISGLSLLILPKVSMISFGIIMSLSFIIYGGYKCITAISTRNFSRHYVLDILVGILLFISGIFLFAAPIFDLMIIMGLISIYFILKSLSTSAFAVQTRKTLNFWWMYLFLSILELIFGIISIIVMPSAALWFMGVLVGIDFILSGIILTNMYISTKYIQGL